MSKLLSCVEVEASEKHTATVIWLHGLGANGHDFEPIVPVLKTPHVRYVFPNAKSIPVTINMGYVMPAWYDILTLDWNAEQREDIRQVEASAKDINALLQAEEAKGIPSERILLAGFSQGAAMTYYVSQFYNKPLAGIMALSGYLVGKEGIANDGLKVNQASPSLSCHGSLDPMVPVQAGREAYEFMNNGQRSALWQEFPIEHEVSVPELDVIGKWIRERLPRLST